MLSLAGPTHRAPLGGIPQWNTIAMLHADGLAGRPRTREPHSGNTSPIRHRPFRTAFAAKATPATRSPPALPLTSCHCVPAASVGHRCGSAGGANDNDGPGMRLAQHRWPSVAVGRRRPTASVGHRCASVWYFTPFVRVGPGAGKGAPARAPWVTEGNRGLAPERHLDADAATRRAGRGEPEPRRALFIREPATRRG